MNVFILWMGLVVLALVTIIYGCLVLFTMKVDEIIRETEINSNSWSQWTRV